MPIGPRGQKRPADTLANALHVARIATGDAEETCRTEIAREAAEAHLEKVIPVQPAL